MTSFAVIDDVGVSRPVRAALDGAALTPSAAPPPHRRARRSNRRGARQIDDIPAPTAGDRQHRRRPAIRVPSSSPRTR